MVLGGVEVPLGNEVEKKFLIVAQTEVKLPPRMAVSCEGRIDTVEKLMKEFYQITPTEKYDNGEEEVAMCSSVVEGRETVPLFLANTASKTITVKQEE